ncbi:methylaspartate mutase accessory protein GlmL [Fuchsiella alkaliacetigena]|uniref:methylaspartate mutase accessory protein GlmL n=1 Tax=Fuchsiella alkaliacetigena TaxID=957042 RepID=UPI00200A7DA1|nr:methylaspartate mutase accessory protein GlmL [Fuchsiella alkaliacetigena]MCK8825350.1 methylaspartate mutase accessory protein GlmL [Fuchsiella alkaliacetigena]
MQLALLLDIGSTYTKGVVIDLEDLELKAKAKALTTVQDDVSIGIKKVLEQLESYGVDFDLFEYRLACSSAAGGLKMVAIGLVPELTAEAAKRAALGAGAKVSNVYTYELTAQEMERIVEEAPDVILLAGGTDGGNKEVILKNAEALAASALQIPIVVAGNKVVANEVKGILVSADKEVYLTENVMPKLEELNIEPARKAIRQVFLEQIIYAKGLAKAEEYIDRVIMPTPSAVMKAAELIAEGSNGESGLGELMVIDIGGATTDIHSVATGEPTKGGVELRGLAEPYVKRTVEGDLGMRYSLPSLVESIGQKKLLATLAAGISEEDLMTYLEQLSQNVEHIPENPIEAELDTGIAKVATKLAVQRHVGRIERVYGPFGESFVQYGKDLTGLKLIIGTGGVLVHNQQPEEILKEALFREKQPQILAPREAEFILDQQYILSAIGLLAEVEPFKAIKLAKKYLKRLGGKRK